MNFRTHAFALTLAACSAACAQSPSPAIVGPERTVSDVHSLLTHKPDDLIGKQVLLSAFVLEQVQVRTMNPGVIRCANHLILIDPDPAVEQRFRALRWDARAPFLRTIPHIITTEVTPGGEGGAILPTKRAAYRGKFLRTTCPDSPIRFKIEVKVKELGPATASPAATPSPAPSEAPASTER